MAWQPQEEPLRQLAQYLKESLSGHDMNAQKNAELVSLPCVEDEALSVADACLDAQASKILPGHQQLLGIPIHMQRSTCINKPYTGRLPCC